MRLQSENRKATLPKVHQRRLVHFKPHSHRQFKPVSKPIQICPCKLGFRVRLLIWSGASVCVAEWRAVGACWAHNPEVDGSKPSSAIYFSHFFNATARDLSSFSLEKLAPDMELLWNTKLRTTAGYCRNSG